MTASAHRFQGALGVGIGALRPPIIIERDPQGAMGVAGDPLRLFERLFRPAARVELRNKFAELLKLRQLGQIGVRGDVEAYDVDGVYRYRGARSLDGRPLSGRFAIGVAVRQFTVSGRATPPTAFHHRRGGIELVPRMRDRFIGLRQRVAVHEPHLNGRISSER